MEPISFTTALASIPAIFTSCVDCYHYVQIGRAFERDYGMVLCKLEASELRLTRWGKAMGITGPDSRLSASLYGEHEIITAYNWLKEIQTAFTTAFEPPLGFKKRVTPEEFSPLDQNPATNATNEPYSSLHKTMRKIIDGRLTPRKRDRIAWALHKREDYESLVGNISELVNNLIELFHSTTDQQARLCQEEAQSMDSDALRSMGSIIGGQDQALQYHMREEINKRKINVKFFQATEHFQGHIGDNNVTSVGQASDIDMGTVLGSGHSTLHIGTNFASVGSARH
ncbi:hypothetical protein PITC_053050 [Penicillium italicum]|uniref:Prion-inhibition and propagation HeLo domain-containing protein n=1 Tax=Penicillium italicum TaxID=40296 RepID=A0A0A2KJM5_PENIT|nr:hypothetical protein PITC_053050 [Penicillium italicum]